MFVVPTETPVTTPVVASTVALLPTADHTPLGTVLLNVSDNNGQSRKAPVDEVIVGEGGITISVAFLVMQPLGPV